ncbi:MULTISPECIES: single-stranded DNA-binding protein [unclassified Halanaerobium]|uniref:single-stranded DNA-binding protein n=1 Tax=unclassified Halanaerobium TaxID=2641197 RepID=UPI000DF2B44C|nr:MULTISPECIES: single-stranded DNA-binding protein [unclassified Halanaerobium]RCW44136.1 single-strand binding protein [Halanaerobium sp. MA284_MarDTE_T2]RCW86994.1 single-strand binding protein [Halanaerobium sp. DL-01]
MLNRIVLIGRLTRDPELRYTSNGTPVCNFTLAVERNYTNRQGERDVDFIKIVTWRGLAENCARHLGKGRLVGVDGSLHIRKSENNNRTYINPEVTADNVRFLDYANSNQNQSQNNNYSDQNKENKQNNSAQNEFDKNFDDEFDPDDFDVPF